MNSLISVIVPVFNIDKYISKCIESIMEQTYKNLQIILVDDGSTDTSGEICDRYAKKDIRIQVIHKKNGGLVSARNAGLEAAAGEYVGFVDGDDWIAEELLEKAQCVLERDDAPDIFVFCYVRVQENGRYEERNLKVRAGLYRKEQLEKEIYPSMICKVEKGIWGGIDSGSLCDKIIKRELMEKYYCKNESLFRGEDSVCAWECMFFADKIFFSDLVMYFYNRLSTSSGQKKYHNDLYENNKKVVEYLRGHLRSIENSQIERQLNAMEFMGIMRAIHQEIDFKHSIRTATLFFRTKYKKKEMICTRHGMPLRNYPYILLLNSHCFALLLTCVIVKKKLDRILNFLLYVQDEE